MRDIPLLSQEKEIAESVELRVSFEWLVAAAIVFTATGLLVTGSAVEGSLLTWKYLLSIFFPFPILAWYVHRHHPNLGTLILSLSLSGFIFLCEIWLHAPLSLYFLALPIVIATISSSLLSGVKTAGVETFLLVLFAVVQGRSIGLTLFIFPAVAVWATLGVITVIYRPIYDCLDWYNRRFMESRREEEEMRSQRMEQSLLIEDLDYANRQMALLNNKNQMLRQLAEQAQQSKASFLARVSHEFRTPLHIIISLTDLLMDTPDLYGAEIPPDLLEDIKIVNRNCDHLAYLVDDILDLSRTEAGQLTLHREWTDISALANEAVDIVKPLLKKKDLFCHLNTDLPDQKVYCDPTRIRQVVLNLLGNAVRYTEKGGISIRILSENGQVIVQVADTGPGLPVEDLKHLFEPFYRGITRPKNETGGSGLGLSICRQFIELHGGKIWVDSTPGVGSKFTFTLPEENPEASYQVNAASPGRWVNVQLRDRKPRLSVSKFSGKKRIAVYDETNKLVPIFSHYSDELEFSSLDRIEDIEKTPAHTVILNLTEPSQLIDNIQKVRKHLDFTPILASSFSSKIIDLAQSGVIDFLIKPFKYKEFQAVAKKVQTPIKRVLIADDDLDIRQLLKRM